MSFYGGIMKIRINRRTIRRTFTGRKTVPPEKFKITKCRTHNVLFIAAVIILAIV